MSNEKWIGEKDDTSGSYYERGTPELRIRKGGRTNSKRLYRFESRFNETYYITEPEVIDVIENLLKIEDCGVEMVEYLYSLVIRKFGAIEFITMIGHKISEQRNEGYLQGKAAKQKEIIKALGLG
ncbi:hypothetical protein [Paenibacillus sp. USHLN196]|uniref:hypothetical protein n=1 Tax=Paenibacillus sp. USHLN196 TaxID=3081291 RepID=UPI0030159D70